MFFGRGVLQCPAATIFTRRLLGRDSNCFLVDSSPPRFAAHLKLVKPSLFFVRNISGSLRASINGISRVRSFGSTSLTMATGNSGSEKKPNRLAQEKSPYLLQHAYNPVDWYPWGEEAFEKAKEEDKLIFLSVGYSTCHWCHVMEHESFENEEIAKVMNEHFINIKVDREERPDVDKVYMTFVQASSGGGGWPMSVFLTPTLMPVAGGTYFPPKDMFGRPGFPTVLNSLATQWKENRQKFFDSGSKILEVLQKHSKLEVSPYDSATTLAPLSDSWRTCYAQLVRGYQTDYGGFGTAPKFPQPANFNFLFHVYARNPTSEEGKEALQMCTHTLKMMAKGGIHDHVSQGFARYATDERWHLPHFEKMLYDQAQLMVAYATAYTATKDEMFAEVTRDIVSYVNRDLSHPLGGFYSAEDADSLPSFDSEKKREGAFCAWTYEEVQALLGDKLVLEGKSVTLAQLACHHYDIKQAGNINPYQDPHDELTGKNILIIIGSEAETAEKFSLSLSEIKAGLQKAREILFEARQKRPRPHLDDKMVAAWNGLMLSGLSKASEALGDESIVERAIDAARFIREHLFDKETGTLLRSCYQGPNGTVSQISSPIAGFADDYAFVVRGLLDLYEASGEAEWLEWAEQLQDKQDALFWDTKAGGYFTAAKDPAIVLRLKEGLYTPKGAWPEYEINEMLFLYFNLVDTLHVTQEIQKIRSAYQDGAEPTCNSVSVASLVRLGSLLERPELQERAASLLAAFSSRLANIPVALPEMSSALLLFQDSPTQVIVAGEPAAESTRAMLSVVRDRLVPGRVLGHADGDKDGVLYRRNETVRRMRPTKPGAASAYVCHKHACSLPVSTPEMLLALLDERLGA